MKRRIFSILFALVLVLSFSLVTAVPAAAATINVPGDYSNIQDAIDAASDGDTIVVARGTYAGATVDKAVVIRGEGRAVINSGPAYGPYTTGFQFPVDGQGSGATISHFRFETVDLPVYSRGANDVTVEHCTMISPLQGISNWGGDGWNISHNVIKDLHTSSGGGIGIFIGSRDGSTANYTLVAHNKITGQIVVPDDDCGGYSGPGICLMSDRRYGQSGGTISGNRILHNTVALSSTNSSLVSSEGIELYDMGLLETTPINDLTGNKVGFNDVRRVDSQPIGLYPDADELREENYISRNLGDDPNRGHGLPPKVLFR